MSGDLMHTEGQAEQAEQAEEAEWNDAGCLARST